MKSFLQNAWFPSMFIWHIMRWWNDAVDTEQALSILLHTQPNINIFIIIFIIIKIINVIKKINNQIINVIIIVMMIVLIIIVIMTIMIIMIRVMLVTWLSKVGCKTASGTWRRRGAELPYIVIIIIFIIIITIIIHCYHHDHHHHHTLSSSSSSYIAIIIIVSSIIIIRDEMYLVKKRQYWAMPQKKRKVTGRLLKYNLLTLGFQFRCTVLVVHQCSDCNYISSGFKCIVWPSNVFARGANVFLPIKAPWQRSMGCTGLHLVRTGAELPYQGVIMITIISSWWSWYHQEYQDDTMISKISSCIDDQHMFIITIILSWWPWC